MHHDLSGCDLLPTLQLSHLSETGMYTELLDPCNDYVFKRMFAQFIHLLLDLINAIRHDKQAVTELTVLNPQILAEEIEGKFIVLDILAKDSQGKHFNIEMQVNPQERWSTRSVYYMARIIGEQLQKGEKYSKLKAVIGIHILAYHYFEDQGLAAGDDGLWCFQMRDQRRPLIKLGDEIELNIIELPKAGRLLCAERQQSMSKLLAWIAYFEQDRVAMNDLAHPPVLEAMMQLENLSLDDDARRMAWQRQRARIRQEMEEATIREESLAEGLQKGEAIGMQKGEAIGVQKARLEALQSLIQKGFSEEQAKSLLDWQA